MKRTLTTLAALFFSLSTIGYASDRWIDTWAASPLTAAMLPATSPKQPDLGLGSSEVTVRQIVHISQGGDEFRISFTNEFGTEPLTLHNVYVGFLSTGSSIVDGTNHPLTFSGSKEVTIAPGKFLTSDSLKMKAPIFSDLVISFELPVQQITTITEHQLANQINFVAQGSHAADASMTGATEFKRWYLLKDVQVKADSSKMATVVTFGDSITDGAQSKVNSNHRWPDLLEVRLAANKKTKHLALANAAISGNRVLHDVYGPRAIDRFDRDVLSVPGVKYLVIMESINDIGRSFVPQAPGMHEEVTTQQIMDALKSLVDRAHAHGIKVIGATLTPFEGASYYTPEGEQYRQTINTWIKTGGVFDGSIDFDKAARDPQAPTKLAKQADSGDHLHPSDVGYQMMADSIDLKLFTK